MKEQNDELRRSKAAVLELVAQNRLVEACDACRMVCRTEPGSAENWYMLATICGKSGHTDEALAGYEKVLTLKPELPEAWFGKALLLQTRGRNGEAEKCYREVLRIRPDYVNAFNNLGNLLFSRGDIAGAEACYRRAVELQPDYADALTNLGKLQQLRCRYSSAERLFRAALKYSSGNADLYNELGVSLNAQGNTEAAEQAFRTALRMEPSFHAAGSNLLLTLNYTSAHSPEQVLEEHRRQGRRLQERVPRRQGFRNDTDPARCLRIGYLSADFRDHSVASFFGALLEHRNGEDFETFCYADVGRADAVTERMRGLSDHWRNIHGRSHEQVIERVLADAIDILVDLGGHTAGNRLPVFAARCAPLQVTYLGYPNTTGLPEMDYRLTDAWSDPPGMTESFYTESLIRLPGCFLCYTPPADAPLPGERTAGEAGAVTFGSFNSYVKMTDEVFELWAAILRAVPRSRLLLKNFSLTDPAVRDGCRKRFAALGLDAERLDLHGVIESKRGHLALYDRVDIGLDTFPYNGTTTTCEALWMGVPVITLAGELHAGRVGVSLLSAAGLQQLIAEDRRSCIELAVSLAGDRRLLRQWRVSLREKVGGSALCDGARFARQVGAAYREIWTRYCTGPGRPQQ